MRCVRVSDLPAGVAPNGLSYIYFGSLDEAKAFVKTLDDPEGVFVKEAVFTENKPTMIQMLNQEACEEPGERRAWRATARGGLQEIKGGVPATKRSEADDLLG